MPVPAAARVRQCVELVRPVVGDLGPAVVYRLLYVELARQRGCEVAAGAALGGPAGSLGAAVVRQAQALLRTDGPAHRDEVRSLADLHQAVLSPESRRGDGAYFTPDPLIDLLLDEALEPVLDETGNPGDVTVCDPACGSGLFLVAAARRLVRRGIPLQHVLEHCLHGVDRDPGAVELTRVCLALQRPDEELALGLPRLSVVRGDALLDTVWDEPFDVVVGNPPFLNRLERRTAPDVGTSRRLTRLSGGTVGPYTDVSAVFLQRATTWVRTGGRIALVQPQSVLAARDASGVRGHLARTCALESLWAADRPVFDAGVLTCAVVLRRGGAQGPVRRWSGAAVEEEPAVEAGDLTGTWSHLVAGALGVPRLGRSGAAPAGGVVADVADCTADFRDQYYGLAPHVREAADAADGVPLVTTGLIDPARNLWGTRPTRFLKRRWVAPVVDIDSLQAEGVLSRWAADRLVPKVLVGTQGRTLEAVVDEHGDWLPSVPTITAVPREVSPWHLLAVLLAPPVSAHAATTYAGAGMSMHAIKLSARQVAALPLPADGPAWDDAALLAQAAQADPGRRLTLLAELGRAMCAAYGEPPEDFLPWWLERLR